MGWLSRIKGWGKKSYSQQTGGLAALIQALIGRSLNVRGTSIPRGNAYELLDRWRGWVYACVMRRANGVTSTPLNLYVSKAKNEKVYEYTNPRSLGLDEVKWLKRSSDPCVKQVLSSPGEILKLSKHAITDLLLNPNPLGDGMDLLELACICMDLVGNAYWLKRLSPDGTPYEVWPLQPQRMAIASTTTRPLDHYEYSSTTMPIIFAPEEIIHFKCPSPIDSLHGFAPLQAAAAAAILEDLIMRYNKALLENDARPDIMLKTANSLTTEQYTEMIERWQSRFGGPDNKGLPAILEGGLELEKLGFSPRELMAPQYLDMVKNTICAIYAVPLSLVTMTSASRASAETGEYSLTRHAILPLCNRLQRKLNSGLVSMWNQPNIFLAFDNPVAEDIMTNAKAAMLRLDADVTVPREEREIMGFPPHEGAWLDKPASERHAARVGAVQKPKPSRIDGEPMGGGTSGAEALESVNIKLSEIIDTLGNLEARS